MKFSERYLDYKDVFIVPQYSEVRTRGDVDISTEIGSELTLKIPVITANMDTISGNEMCIAMAKNGAIGALHRAFSIETNVNEYRTIRESGVDCFVTVGATGDFQERAQALFDRGARNFIIDIAHGHSFVMKQALSWFKKQYGSSSCCVMAGNVATPEAVKDLEYWGADIIKVGVGPGAVCKTKSVTGVTFPQFHAVWRCAKIAHVPIVADGGMKEYGDIAKAIGAGASAVMTGYFFAGTQEVPPEFRTTGVYRGMASKEAQKVLRTQNNTNLGVVPTPEGISINVEPKGSVLSVLDEMAGALRSTYSYTGAFNTKEFQQKVQFGVRY